MKIISPSNAEKVLKLLFLGGLLLRVIISGRIYYWSNYLFLFWFSGLYLSALVLKGSNFHLPRILQISWGLFLGGLLISMPMGIHPLLSARELVIFVSYFFIFISAVEIFSKAELRPLLLTIIIAMLVHILMGIRQYLGGLENAVAISGTAELGLFEQIQLKRIFGLTFSPDFFSCLSGTGLILMLALFKWNGEEKNLTLSLKLALNAILGILFLISMVLTKSLGGFLAFLVGLFALMLLKWGKNFSLKKLLSIGIVIMLFAGIIFSIFIYQRRAIFFKKEHNPIYLRIENFRAGLEVYLEKPWFGVGAGNFWIAYPKYRPAMGNEIRYVHNNFIQVLAEAGPIAGTGLVLLIFYLFWALRKNQARGDDTFIGIWCGALVLWSHWLWDFGLYVPELASIFFVLLAGAALKTELGSSPKLSRASLILLGFLIFLLWLAGSWLFFENWMVKKAGAYFYQGKRELAEFYANKALKIIPMDDYALGLLARVNAPRKDDDSKTIAYYQKAIQLNPRFAFWHRELADFYLSRGKLNQAEAEYLKALELYPHKLEFLARLAQIYRGQGKLTQAEDYAQNALLVMGDHRLPLWELVRIKLAKGEKPEAIKILEKLEREYNDPGAKNLLTQIKSEAEQ